MISRRLALVLALLAVSASAAGAQAFEYRTFLAGLGSVTGANGVAVADYDGDGDLDVYLVARNAYDPANPTTWNRLFANRGDGTFTDATLAAGVAGAAGLGLPSTGGNGAKLGAAWGDYDGDGDPDLYLTHAGPNQLYRNDGGTFTDVTAEAGVAGGATHLSTSALWFDADLDGDLDLHVGVWEDYALDGQPRDLANPYFENLGSGTFREASAQAGLGDTGKTYATLPVDVDGDGDLDLYDANDFGPNRLYLNAGDGTFTEATAAFGLEDSGEGMGLALGDPTGDGLADLFLTNRSDAPGQSHALFVGRAAGGYEEQAAAAGVAETGWGWGAEFFDLENDGDEDLFVVNGYVAEDTPNTLFVNCGAFPFIDAAPSLGVADLDAGRGLAVFDADADGRLDVIVANVSRSPFLYANRTASGAWLAVDLSGTAPNTSGLGAVVEVEAGGRRWVRFHHGAQFLGQNLTPVHVGLGDVEVVDRLTVRWLGGETDEVAGLAVDQRVRVGQGRGLIEGETVDASPSPDAPLLRVLSVAPNPTTEAIAVEVSIPSPMPLRLRVVDALGRVVRVLSLVATASPARVEWDGRDGAGRRVSPGVYRVIVEAESGRATGSVTLLR